MIEPSTSYSQQTDGNARELVPFVARILSHSIYHRANIETELRAGNTVICDRYAFSGVAFSAAKSNLTYDWCKAPDVSLPAPDAVLFLDVSPGVARLRGGYGEERYEKEEMQIRVREIFRRIEADTVQSNSRIIWSTIDASGTLEEVEGRIKEATKSLHDGVAGKIDRLWV